MNGVPKQKLREQEESKQLHDEFIANGGKVKVLPAYDELEKATKHPKTYNNSKIPSIQRAVKRNGEVLALFNKIKADHKTKKSAGMYISEKLDINYNTVKKVLTQAGDINA